MLLLSNSKMQLSKSLKYHLMSQNSQVSKIVFLLFMIAFVGKLAWQLSESVAAYTSYPTSKNPE